MSCRFAPIRAGAALLLGWLLCGCNVFNPSGTGSYPKDDADAWVDLGQRALQDLRFEEAYVDFSRALALDSSRSLAYQGLAKAELQKDGFTISRLVDLADSISGVPDTGKLNVLLGLGDTGLTNLYRPIMRVASIYGRLIQLDSAGRTDGRFPARLIQNEYTTIMGNRAYFLLIDGNRDTVIQPGELAGLKLMNMVATSGGADGLKLNAQQLIESGNLDTVTGALPDSTRNSINGILTNVSAIASDTELISKLVNSASGGIAGATGISDSITQSINQNVQTFIQQLGTSTTFFLINDSLDNDGDGCVNEEVFGDSTDNDGDSLIDEDGRVGLKQGSTPVPGQLALITPADGFLHDRMALNPRDSLKLVPGNDELVALTWATSKGILTPYRNLRWVRWDDASVGNDTIWTRICAQNNTTPAAAPSLVNYLEIRTLGIVEVRKKVLAQPPTRARAALGKKLVGGCWDNVQ